MAGAEGKWGGGGGGGGGWAGWAGSAVAVTWQKGLWLEGLGVKAVLVGACKEWHEYNREAYEAFEKCWKNLESDSERNEDPNTFMSGIEVNLEKRWWTNGGESAPG